MPGITLLIAQLKSCPGALSRFRFFDLMFIRIENPCSHSQVEEKISSYETAWEAGVGYEKVILSQKFIAEHSLRCFFCGVRSSFMSISSSCTPVPLYSVLTGKSAGSTEKGTVIYGQLVVSGK